MEGHEGNTPKAIHMFNVIPTNFFFGRNGKSQSSNSYGLCREPLIAKTILQKK